jgi:hypothetical protein
MDFDPEELFDSLNLSGQWQPSIMPDISDSILNSQILDGFDLFQDGPSSIATHTNSINSDDISSALIDMTIDPFDTLTSLDSQSSFENDDMVKFLTSPIEDLPKQSIIEDKLERMNLNQSQTDILSSPISVQIGSSPIEPKEIENSILARDFVREQHRIMKRTSKPKRTSGYQQPSSTVGPIDVLSSYGVCQPCTTVQMQDDFDYQQQLQFDTMESKQIQIKSQPRSKFRPRTQNESRSASHYIRCEQFLQDEYPSIYVPHSWALQSAKNIIQVTLVGIDQQPHAYAIENKSSKNSFDDDALIFRQNDLHTLYFRVTDEDFKNGYKCLMMEFIKSKQDNIITKDLIKTRKLDQSMLRFTRFYQADKNTYERDEGSVEYSCVMTEAYGDVAVEHMGPRYGPMSGQEMVYLLLKGRIVKEDLIITVTEDTTGWNQRVTFTKNGNVVYFSMPSFPHSHFDHAIANISIYYKGEELHQATYLYKGSLDQDLAVLNLNDSPAADPCLGPNFGSGPNPGVGPSTSNYFNGVDFFSATGACPIPAVSRKSSATKRPKRLGNK